MGFVVCGSFVSAGCLILAGCAFGLLFRFIVLFVGCVGGWLLLSGFVFYAGC